MANWFLLTLVAAVFLGLYDIAKKHAVDSNAVPPVLLLNVSTSATIWSVPIVCQWFTGQPLGWIETDLTSLSLWHHVLLVGKSALVGTSWMLAFVAIKHLPISIASPIRATSPIWTIALAVMLMNERPLMIQWMGVALIVAAFYSFSLVSLKEGIQFSRDRHIWLMIAATFVSAFCGLYDKYLLQIVGLKPLIVQSWFSIYLVPVMLPIFIYWYRHDRETTPLQLRFSIPLIALFLLFADYFYFVAIAQPDALISLITPLRRSSIVIAFLWGIFFLREKNWQPKLACLLILWTGIYLISLGK